MTTEYKYFGIKLKDNGNLRRAGDPSIVYGPELRILVGKRDRLEGIMLTEAEVFDTAADCLRALRWFATQREASESA